MRRISIAITLAALVLPLQAHAFGKNKVRYHGFDWHYIQTPEFDVYFYKGEQDIAEFAAGVLADASKDLSLRMGHVLRERVPIIVYRSHNDFQMTNVISELIPEGVGGFTELFKKRLVVPFTGSYEDFRHVLHHELVHVYQYDILYGDFLGNVFSPGVLYQMPLWLAEGMAEYYSRGGWDVSSDMYLRDAAITGYMYPPDEAGGFMVYKIGQSFLTYIAGRFGEDKIPALMRRGKAALSTDKMVKAVLGIEWRDLVEDWQKAMRVRYWPEIARRDDPGDVARALTDHERDNSHFNEKPAFAPSGDRIAFFSDRSDYTEVYVMSTVDGRVLSRLTKAERSGDFESLHAYVSGIAWSPDGQRVAFVAKADGRDVIYVLRVRDGHVVQKIDPGLDNLRDPDWSPDGKRLAFYGTKGARPDVYVYDLGAKKVEALTSDFHDDSDPTWSPDGKMIAFVSDRPDSGEAPASPAAMSYGRYRVWVMDVATKSMRPITSSAGDASQPDWCPADDRIAYVSDENGIRNVYVVHEGDGNTYPVTNILGGAYSPSWAPDGKSMVFSAFASGGWDIFLLKSVHPYQTADGVLAPSAFLSEGGPSPLAAPDTAKSLTDTASTRTDYSTYVFTAGPTERPGGDTSAAARDTAAYRNADGTYRIKRYRAKFTPDIVSGMVGYDSFYGFSGQTLIAISDIMGDQRFIIGVNLTSSIDESDLFLSYENMAHRIGYTLFGFHFLNYYEDFNANFFADRIVGGGATFSRPFSMFTRFDLGAAGYYIRRDYIDPDYKTDDSFTLLNSAAMVHDGVRWGITGPVDGGRWYVAASFAPRLSDKALSFYSGLFDWRRYVRLSPRYSIALRLSGGASAGRDPQRFYLGGMAGWIGGTSAESDVYAVPNLYFGEYVVPLRGYRLYEFSGTRYALANVEFRYPFVENLRMRFPLPLTLFYLTGAWFADVGAAWDGDDFKGGTSGVEGGNPHLQDVKFGFGFGVRANLGIFVLKYDAGWRTDFDYVSPKPRHYFTLGAEF